MSRILFFSLSISVGAWAGELERKLQAAIAVDFPPGTEVVLERLQAPRRPAGDFRIESLLPRPSLGLVSFQVREGDRTSSGTVFVRAWSRVAVAKQPIAHKEAFTDQNVSFESRELSEFAARGYFPDLAGLRKKRARGLIRAGQALGVHNTDTPFDVEPGKAMELLSGRGSVQIRARVRSLDAGRVGETVRVENLSSRKLVRARVLDSETVEVN